MGDTHTQQQLSDISKSEREKNRPKIPTPTIKPERKTPGYTPQKSPTIPQKTNQEIHPGTQTPELLPQQSPDAYPQKTPPEVPSHNDPYAD